MRLHANIRLHSYSKTSCKSGVQEPPCSTVPLRIRRCLPAGLNGRAGQMFVVVNKFCCPPPGPKRPFVWESQQNRGSLVVNAGKNKKQSDCPRGGRGVLPCLGRSGRGHARDLPRR